MSCFYLAECVFVWLCIRKFNACVPISTWRTKKKKKNQTKMTLRQLLNRAWIRGRIKTKRNVVIEKQRHRLRVKVLRGAILPSSPSKTREKCNIHFFFFNIKMHFSQSLFNIMAVFKRNVVNIKRLSRFLFAPVWFHSTNFPTRFSFFRVLKKLLRLLIGEGIKIKSLGDEVGGFWLKRITQVQEPLQLLGGFNSQVSVWKEENKTAIIG